ncbi:MAG: ankyrin repeat domain-containing protein [Truepera sp.]|nr:ankyrin repeat domain-containing protein [Truepera sp.]
MLQIPSRGSWESLEVDARDGGDWTPLHDAAESNSDSAIVAALLAAGARVNAREVNGWTPLHFAARFSSSPGVIAALLDAGADAAARDDDGKIPWDYAREREGLQGTDAYWRLNEGRFR